VKKETDFGNLYKKIDATSKTRFHSSRRLKLHTKLSTLTIVFISLVLIFTSLMQAYDLGINITSKYLALIQVFSSITVLIYSLLIDKNDFSSFSEKMYSCASRLGELKQKIYPYIQDGSVEQYNQFKDDYNSILKLYETAAINDFRGDYMRAQLDMPENYIYSNPKRAYMHVKIVTLYAFNFIQYALVYIVFFALIYWLLVGPLAEK
jgi:hypothetical protein